MSDELMESVMPGEGMSKKDYDIHAVDWLKEFASSRNCYLIEPGPRELLLDIDSDTEVVTLELWQQRNQEVMYMIQDRFNGCHVKNSWQSRNGKGLHVVLVLGVTIPLDLMVALQAALGSDPAHEAMLAFERTIHPDVDLRCLFKPRQTFQLRD